MIPDFLNPKQTIDALSFLKENMIACDIGSGSGGWTIPLAKKLENGKVYAVDIKEEALSALRSKLDSERIYNVELILADIEKGVKIQNNKVDLVIISNILFELNDKKKTLEEIKRILKEEGYLFIIDWKKLGNVGPKDHAISRDEMKEMASELNLKLEQDFDLGHYHWALIFRK